VFLLTIVVTFQLHHCGCMINKCYVYVMFIVRAVLKSTPRPR